VPRIVWPGKPIDPGFDLPSMLGMKGVSLSSSIIGEWYISYGWLAMLFGAWLHGRMALGSQPASRIWPGRAEPGSCLRWRS
jgi:hypothetical protein